MLSQLHVLSEVTQGTTVLVEAPDSEIHVPAINQAMFDLALACVRSGKYTTLIQMRHTEDEVSDMIGRSAAALGGLSESEKSAVSTFLQTITIPQDTVVPWKEDVRNVLTNMIDRRSECIIFVGVPGDLGNEGVLDLIGRIRARNEGETIFYQSLELFALDKDLTPTAPLTNYADAVFTYKQRGITVLHAL